MPELDNDEEEIKRGNVKNELRKIFMNYRSKHCDNFGSIFKNNLNEKQLKSIKELKTKMKDEELVCYKTDKTEKFAIDTVENYSAKMEKHIKNDLEITEKKITRVENKLNEHMEDWAGFTKVGEKTEQFKRLKSNLKT